MSTTPASRIALGLCAFATSVTLVGGTACVGSDASPVVVVSVDGAVGEMPTGPDAGADERLPSVGGPGTGGDGGGVVDATAGVDATGPWTPARIAGVALWLDGDTAVADVNGRVATWTDKSGAGNDATTATDAQKPVLLTGASGLNSHHALHFDGTSTFMTIADKASARWTQSFVIEAVFRRIEAPAAPILAKATAIGAQFNGIVMYMGTVQYNPSTFKPIVEINLSGFREQSVYNTPFDEGVTHRVRTTWDATTTTLSIQLDKAAPVTDVQTGVTGTDAIGHDLFLGRNFDGTQHIKAEVAEIVAIAGAAVDPADILMLQSYLDAKYGL
jgi:hypothetical protein